jgi:hypothetical protein
VDLLFQTNSGIVKLSVEAYVVKGMSTDFILGNDFADQYDLSIKRKEGTTRVEFGEAGHYLEVSNSLSPQNPYIVEQGHTFKVLTRPDYAQKIGRHRAHRKAQTRRKGRRRRLGKLQVRSSFDYTIPPCTNRLIRVEADFPEPNTTFVVERSAFFNSTPDELYAMPETLISPDKPYVWISNFANLPITISSGQLIGHLQNPANIYSSPTQLSSEDRFKLSTYARFIQNYDPFTQSNYSISKRNAEGNKEEEQEAKLSQNQPVEGGPKTAEIPEEITIGDELLQNVDISTNLTSEERQEMERVLQRNHAAFALDGRLGNYKENVRIPLVPETKPISIPPFPMSPANREIIDKQMDSWLKLEVIEPSKSPWAAPVFIVHRNGKPRMVIRLSEVQFTNFANWVRTRTEPGVRSSGSAKSQKVLNLNLNLGELVMMQPKN